MNQSKIIEKDLHDVAEVASGQGAPQGEHYFGKTGHYFVRAGNLDDLLVRNDYQSLERIDAEVAVAHKLRLFPLGTILFAKSGMSATKDRVVILEHPSYVTNHLAALVPSADLNPKYLMFWLRKFRPSRLVHDESYPSIRLSDIARVKIPLPPLPVQKKIAAILEKADQARRKRQQANRLTEQFLQSAFIKMFGDPVRNPKGLPIMSLEQVSDKKRGAIKCGPFGSQLLISELKDTGIPVYGIDNVGINEFIWAKPKFITLQKYNELKAFSIDPGDVLISRTGTVGRTCLAPNSIPKSIIGPNLLKVTLDKNKLLPVVLSCAFNFCRPVIEKIKSMSPGATVAVFNTTNLRSLKIPIPSMYEQQKFAALAEKVELFRKKQRLNEQELETLFQSLVQRAFK